MTRTGEAPTATVPETGATCGNCGTSLLGPHCHACGQPVHGLVRHFGSLVGDVMDSVFNLDARTPRTLWPLFLRPGHLTLEYFAGRRVRYVTPVRLFFFLAIVTFFFAQLTISVKDDTLDINAGAAGTAIAGATTEEEVRRHEDAALARIEAARDKLDGRTGRPRIGPDPALIATEAAIRSQAADRLVELREAAAAGQPPPPPAQSNQMADFSFTGKPWHPVDNPLHIGWLPEFANAWLNQQVGRTQKNVTRVQEDPDLFKDAALGAVPSTLLLLLPVFALMLKMAYVFRRRLYMEHLIVALHSHAFLCLAMLLLFVSLALQRWLAPDGGALHVLFDAVGVALWIWMPLYLLLMQKRVYGQGWPMTLLKYAVIGNCYIVLLSFGAVFTVLAGLVWL
jgi:hypothetical protein